MDMRKKKNELAVIGKDIVNEEITWGEVTAPEIKKGIKEGVQFLKKEIEKNPELKKKVIYKVVEKKIIDEVEQSYNKDNLGST